MSTMIASARPEQLRRHVSLAFDGIALEYGSARGATKALTDVNIAITGGRFVAIVGPSGCGKSSLLHLASGILRPTRGRVFLGEEQLTGMANSIGYMFQTDALLPWKTVSQNIGLALTLQRFPPEETRRRVEYWLARTGLQSVANAYPAQLSGGMRKRIAIAQALIHEPPVVLMDEPLAALDAQNKLIMGNELLQLWEGTGSTVLFVTHDIHEAICLADEIIVMTAGPGRVKSRYGVDLPRPRDLRQSHHQQSYHDLHAAIWSDLQEEVLKAHAAT